MEGTEYINALNMICLIFMDVICKFMKCGA
jgi:hypothetical protein